MQRVAIIMVVSLLALQQAEHRHIPMLLTVAHFQQHLQQRDLHLERTRLQ